MLPFRNYLFRGYYQSGRSRIRPLILASIVGSVLAGGVTEAAPPSTTTVLLVPHPISGSTGPAYLNAKPAAAELAGISFHHAFLGPGQTGWHQIPGPNGTVKGWKLAFALKGHYVRLRTLAGVADGLRGGSARFRVVGDGKTLYTSPIKHSGDDPLNLDLKVAGVKNLALMITGTDAGVVPSLVIWADPIVYPAGARIPAPPAWPQVATNQKPGTDPDAVEKVASANTDNPSEFANDQTVTSGDSTSDAATNQPSSDTTDTSPADSASQDTSTQSADNYPQNDSSNLPQDASVDSVFSWSEVPTNAPVPIVRAVFDQNGYQLFDDQGETIVIPFTDHNLYVMKFAQSETDSMYFINDGTAPILYIPRGGYVENATVPGAKWYPFPNAFHPGVPVYLGPAASWSDFENMCWYPDMVYWGGYWSESAWVGDDVFVETPGIVFVVDGYPCYGWGAYHQYLYGHGGYYHTTGYRPVVYNYPGHHGPGGFHHHPGWHDPSPGHQGDPGHGGHPGGGDPWHGGHPTHPGGNGPGHGNGPGSGGHNRYPTLPGLNSVPGRTASPGRTTTPGRTNTPGPAGNNLHVPQGGFGTRGGDNHPSDHSVHTQSNGNGPNHAPSNGNGPSHTQNNGNGPVHPSNGNGPARTPRQDNRPSPTPSDRSTPGPKQKDNSPVTSTVTDDSRPWMDVYDQNPLQGEDSPPPTRKNNVPRRSEDFLSPTNRGNPSRPQQDNQPAPQHDDQSSPQQPEQHDDPPAQNDPPAPQQPEHHDDPAPKEQEHHDDPPAPKHDDPSPPQPEHHDDPPAPSHDNPPPVPREPEHHDDSRSRH